MNEIFAFWFAYVVTRPIGASFADYFSKPKDISGLGFGDLKTAGVITLLVVGPRRLHESLPASTSNRPNPLRIPTPALRFAGGT